MTRKELYTKIRNLSLQEEVKNTYDKNFTQVSNDNLERIIWKYDATLVDEDPDENIDASERYSHLTEDLYQEACFAFVQLLKNNKALNALLNKFY